VVPAIAEVVVQIRQLDCAGTSHALDVLDNWLTGAADLTAVSSAGDCSGRCGVHEKTATFGRYLAMVHDRVIIRIR
jgi:hypothetical protein